MIASSGFSEQSRRPDPSILELFAPSAGAHNVEIHLPVTGRDRQMVEEGRAEPRSRLFLTAQLRIAGGPPVNVTIRNISSTGALIEVPRQLEADTEVELVRGELVCTGAIAWAQAGRCGIRFHAPVDLAAWLPTRIVSAGQQRVDDMQASVKAGGGVPSIGDSPSNASKLDVSARVAQELGYVSRLLEAVGDELATDQMAARHGAQLQNLDIAIQLLGHLANVLTAPDSAFAIKQIGMQELRRRMSRKSL